MKTYIMLNLLVSSMPLTITWMMIELQYSYIQNPIKQMTLLMFYILFLTLMSWFTTISTLNTIIITLTFMTGIMILFSYFLCLINTFLINEKHFIKKLITGIMLIILSTLYNETLNNFLNMKYYIHKYDNKLHLFYFNNKVFILILLTIMLSIILYLSFKICYNKKKNLRSMF